MSGRILKSRTFARWARHEDLDDSDLCRAAREIEDGLVDARLGGFLLKKRIGRPHGGKSGGFRTIVAYRQGERMFFIYGFAKNERDNIEDAERMALIRLGHEYMACSDRKLAELIETKVLSEVACDG